MDVHNKLISNYQHQRNPKYVIATVRGCKNFT